MPHRYRYDDPPLAPPAATQLRLDDIRVQIGDSLQLVRLGEPGSSPIQATLIGWVKGQSVLVGMPALEQLPMMIIEGEAFVARLTAANNIYAFSTTVLRTVSAPFPYVHLAFPATVSGLAVRKDSRAPVKIIAAIHRDDDALQAAGIIDNLSVSGASVVTRGNMGSRGVKLIVKFKVSAGGVEASLALPCIIRTVDVDRDYSSGIAESRYGLEFLSDGATPVLAQYVSQQLLHQSIPGTAARTGAG